MKKTKIALTSFVLLFAVAGVLFANAKDKKAVRAASAYAVIGGTCTQLVNNSSAFSNTPLNVGDQPAVITDKSGNPVTLRQSGCGSTTNVYFYP